MPDQNKYRITRTILRFEDGSKDVLVGSIETDDLMAERKRIKAEFQCKKVEFRFYETDSKSNYRVKHGNG